MYVVGNVLFGDDQRVYDFVTARVPNARPLDKFVSLGILRNGNLVGGATFFNYTGHDIEVSFACDGVAWARPETLRVLFSYPFTILNCVRATAKTSRKNRRARKLLEHLGCKLEGVMLRGFDGKQDMCLYRMLKQECKWL